MPSRAHFERDTRWNLDDVGLNLSSDWPAAGSCRFCQQDSGQGVYPPFFFDACAGHFRMNSVRSTACRATKGAQPWPDSQSIGHSTRLALLRLGSDPPRQRPSCALRLYRR